MSGFKHLPLAGMVGASIAAGLGLTAWAGGDKVAFPVDHAKGKLYATVDRADNKQVREFYAPAAAVDAARKDRPMPSGTVLTMVQYAAQLDPQGNPVKDANGRFVKGNLAGYAVMEKRTGWGAEYPDNVRNGEWEYQAFTAAGAVNDKANLSTCFGCHKPHAANDYLFTLDKLKTAMP